MPTERSNWSLPTYRHFLTRPSSDQLFCRRLLICWAKMRWINAYFYFMQQKNKLQEHHFPSFCCFFLSSGLLKWPLTSQTEKLWNRSETFLLCCCNSADVTTVFFHLQHLELILGPCVKLSRWLTIKPSLVTYIPQRITSDAFSSLWSTLATFPAVSDHQFLRTSSVSAEALMMT